MTRQWTGEPNNRDVADVRRLARQAASSDPDLGELYVDADPHLMRWVLLIGLTSCVISLAGIGLIVVEVARHWVGLAQLLLAATVLTALTLAVDSLCSAAAELARRARRWFQ